MVNHNVPRSPKTYVHRIGRSARAGRFGAAITFVTQHDIVLLQAIETSIGRRLEKLTVNDQKVINLFLRNRIFRHRKKFLNCFRLPQLAPSLKITFYNALKFPSSPLESLREHKALAT